MSGPMPGEKNTRRKNNWSKSYRHSVDFVESRGTVSARVDKFNLDCEKGLTILIFDGMDTAAAKSIRRLSG